MVVEAAWPLKKDTSIVEVEWVDSSSLHGWHSAADAAAGTGNRALPCRSVGYLWKRNKHRLLLVQSQSGSGMLDEAFAIPARAITRVRTLGRAGGP